jgi:hypothetical protein
MHFVLLSKKLEKSRQNIANMSEWVSLEKFFSHGLRFFKSKSKGKLLKQSGARLKLEPF